MSDAVTMNPKKLPKQKVLLIEGLPPTEKQILLLLLNGRELDEISIELRIPAKQIQSLITQLQKKATEYWTKDE